MTADRTEVEGNLAEPIQKCTVGRSFYNKIHSGNKDSYDFFSRVQSTTVNSFFTIAFSVMLDIKDSSTLLRTEIYTGLNSCEYNRCSKVQ